MIGKCDQCFSENRKLKYVDHHGDLILAICRFGCDSRRSIPSAKNRIRSFEIISIDLIKTYEETLWEVRVQDEHRRNETFRLRRYSGETQKSLESMIKMRCTNAKQISSLSIDIHYD
jgi:hypothetical protein